MAVSPNLVQGMYCVMFGLSGLGVIVLLAAALTVGVMLIGSGFAAMSGTKWWRRWAGHSNESIIDPAVDDAMEVKRDLQCGRRMSISRDDDADAADGNGGGGGDGGGADWVTSPCSDERSGRHFEQLIRQPEPDRLELSRPPHS